jgi:eukaryotic-like serine/threonine-protein kinase
MDHTVALTPGARIGPYEILAPLGTGGMGEVWKARDTRLGRSVAIKRLTSHSDRFEHEARAIAALNHPHICQIYDIGPDYLVLEYVEGVPLQGPLKPDEAVRLAIQMASALEAAHRRGILHRDLKPANVLMMRGSGEPSDPPAVKLLDFGLAKMLSPDGDVTQTMDGAIVGSAAYMSPEQAEGQPLDARSDIFSFGTVLYEMLAGSRAFAAATAMQVLRAVAQSDPPPLQTWPALDRIVQRCLRKSPGQRYQTITEVKAALEQVAREQAATTVAQPSIAVLPFANMSPDKENEYFSDGLAEEIINALTHIPGLKVIARTSAFAFKGQNTDVRRIAEALGVVHVLEGSVRKAGNRIRVTAQLITAADGTHLWSERYDRELADIFAIQDEIAQAIAGALEMKLAGTPAHRRRYTPNLAAYEAFLRGRHHVFRFTPESWSRGIECFQEAIALDPRYARPHAELGLAHLLAATNGVGMLRQSAALIRREAQLALDLDPSDPSPNFLIGVLAAVHDYDWSEAAARFQVALDQTPVASDIHWAYASFYLQPLGRFEEAAAEMQREVDLDPLNVVWRSVLSSHFTRAERYDDAIANADKALEINADHWLPLFFLCEVHVLSGALERAVAVAERAHRAAPWQEMNTGMLAGVLSRLGETDRAVHMIQSIKDSPLKATSMMLYHIVREEADAAADWFERMIEVRDPFAILYAQVPITKSLRASPRWARLAQLMNLPGSSKRI